MGQLDLFGSATRAVGWDRELRELRRVELGEGAWLDLAPGCVSGHLALFDELARTTRWREESRSKVPNAAPRMAVIARSGSRRSSGAELLRMSENERCFEHGAGKASDMPEVQVPEST